MSSTKTPRFSGPLGLSRQAQGIAAINIAAVIFGTAALYGKLNVSPFWIVAMRAGFGAVTLGLLGGSSLTSGASLRPRGASSDSAGFCSPRTG